MLDIQWNHRGQSAIRGRGEAISDLIFRHLSDLLGPLCQGGRGGSPGALHQPSSRNTAEVAIKLFYNRAYSLDYDPRGSIYIISSKLLQNTLMYKEKLIKILSKHEKNSPML